MAPIVNYLGKKDYLIGENLTLIDFYFLELCDFAQFLTNDEFFALNENIAIYVMNMK